MCALGYASVALFVLFSAPPRLTPGLTQAMDTDYNNNNPWTWEYALDEAIRQLNSISSGENGAQSDSDETGSFSPGVVQETADVAFQGYRALVVSFVWRGVV